MTKSSLLGKNIFPLGIGTWGLGGYAEKDPSNNDSKQIDALIYMFSRGMNLIMLNAWYAEGKGIELVREAIAGSGVDREELILHQAIYSHGKPKFEEANVELDKVLEAFGTDYIDSLEFGALSFKKYGKNTLFDFYHETLDSGKIRSVSITNASFDLLKEFYREFRERIFAHEITFNFEIRVNEDLGLVKFAEDKRILNIVYQPLRRNRTAKRNWPLLVELAEKYGKTQNQIVLQWLVSKGFLPLFKSQNKEHIDENIGALDFQMEEKDIDKMNEFRPPKWKTPKIDWNYTGKGVTVDQLSNVFDERYDAL